MVETFEKTEETIIECDCGMHMLKVQSDVTFFKEAEANEAQFCQDISLAMFSYGNQKRGFFARCRIAWDYLRTGKMFSDQLCLNPDEAKKLATFITDNIVEAEPLKE